MAPSISDEVLNSGKNVADCQLPMGLTSENVARDFKVTRAEQDQLAALSHQKAAKAQQDGLFKDEIVPIGSVSADDGIRPDTSVAGLSKLKTSFSDDGTTTAGNSSQVSDGAAAVLLARRSVAEKLKLTILGKFVGCAVKGVAPRVMGIGPAVAIPQVLQQTGLKIDDIGIFELNEAFASQAVYCIKKLKLPLAKVNPKGGAIALGHPLGATGARQIATLMPELRRRACKYGVVSMCIGTGMGAAAVIENEQ
jgi:acetyl-CoA acyltransferase 1